MPLAGAAAGGREMSGVRPHTHREQARSACVVVVVEYRGCNRGRRTRGIEHRVGCVTRRWPDRDFWHPRRARSDSDGCCWATAQLTASGEPEACSRRSRWRRTRGSGRARLHVPGEARAHRRLPGLLRDLILRRAHDQVHGQAQPIFHVRLRTIDGIGSQFPGQKRHERVPRTLRRRNAE